MRKALIPALLLVLGAIILGATLFPEQIVHAATPFTNVVVGNTTSNPVPVTVQNTDPNGAVKVHEQGTASVAQSGDWNVRVANTADHPVPVSGAVSVSNLPATQPVSGTVDVGNFPSNFPAAPTTEVIAHGVTTVPAGDVPTVFVDNKDVSDYREVTLYLLPSTTGGTGQLCIADTAGPDQSVFTLDEFGFGDSTDIGLPTIKTYQPAPPNFRLECFNNLSQDVQDRWMLVGRTG